MDKKEIVVKGYIRNKQEDQPTKAKDDNSIYIFLALTAAYAFALLVKNAPQVAGTIIIIMVALVYAKQIGELVRLIISEVEDYRNRPRLRINKYRR